MTTSDVLRDGTQRGIFLRKDSGGQITDDFICGMDQYGIELTTEAGAGGTIKVAGTTTVFNLDRGVQIDQVVGSPVANVTFSTSDGAGGNAFTANTNANFAIANNVASTIQAGGNQWERCGTGAACVVNAIQTQDVFPNQNPPPPTPPPTAHVVVDSPPPQPQRNPNPPTLITAVEPTKVARAGAIVRIKGSGFNAIDGPNMIGPNCGRLADVNKCSPSVQGMCIEFEKDNGTWVPAQDILGVTPTTITVRSPIACSKPRGVRVKRLSPDPNPSPLTFQFADVFCKN